MDLDYQKDLRMTRVQKIIDRARATLADPDKTRWSDERLLTLLSEGQQDMSIRCLLLKKKVFIPLFDGQFTYGLPSDFIKLDAAWASAETSRIQLAIEEFNAFYRLNRGQSIGGQPRYIVTGLTNRHEIMIYPTPSDTTREAVLPQGDILGVLACDEDNIKCDSPWGLVGTVDISDEVISDSPYGILTDFDQVVSTLELLYYYKPNYLTSLNDELEIADTCDAGLRHYVVGMALRDDMDTRNRAAGTEELSLYDIEVKRNISDRAGSFTHERKEVYSLKVRTGFEE